MTEELLVNSDTPPTFIFATADDPHANSALVMAGSLRDASVAVELHRFIYYPKEAMAMARDLAIEQLNYGRSCWRHGSNK